MAADDHVRWTLHGRVGRITLDRPERRNALTEAMWTRLAELATGLPGEVRALVVDGAGGAFSSGNDIEMLQTSLTDPEATRRFHELVDRALQAVRDLPIPTIAAVDGVCFGAGLMLATVCDLRMAAADARFCAPPAKLGLVYGIGETQALVDVVGPARAKELLFTARAVDSAEAVRIGLAERAADGPAGDAAMELAEEIAALSAVTHRASKRLVAAAAARLPHAPWMEELRDQAVASDDFREGRAAFFAKRRPEFG
ncbi:enoyl-CoA hydratase/isomerase family protein [Geminicoccus flavidas]|uniref:enoyl-CoA hydratase/isomerase family protein n=1 Tax=Geminicoccus flavidas TaxID=2506407 RepID=UPI0013571D40|nr:enoyl-CoA hydratase-related protein [Geminicoccus flavidas]